MEQQPAAQFLGKDIDGNDVYAGDTVEMLAECHSDEFIGRVTTVQTNDPSIEVLVNLLIPSLAAEVTASTPEGNCVVLRSSRKVTEVH